MYKSFCKIKLDLELELGCLSILLPTINMKKHKKLTDRIKEVEDVEGGGDETRG